MKFKNVEMCRKLSYYVLINKHNCVKVGFNAPDSVINQLVWLHISWKIFQFYPSNANFISYYIPRVQGR